MDGIDYDFEELRHHWGEAYLICRPEPDVWVAQRRDDRSTVRATDPNELHEAILADYTARPVPR